MSDPFKSIGRRLAQVADLYGTRAAAAQVAGISTDQLARYINGSSPRLGFAPVARLCQAKGISLEWLWNGEGGMQQSATAAVPLDLGLLERVLDGVERELARQGAEISPQKRALLVRLSYEHCHNGGSYSAEKIMQLTRMALGRGAA